MLPPLTLTVSVFSVVRPKVEPEAFILLLSSLMLPCTSDKLIPALSMVLSLISTVPFTTPRFIPKIVLPESLQFSMVISSSMLPIPMPGAPLSGWEIFTPVMKIPCLSSALGVRLLAFDEGLGVGILPKSWLILMAPPTPKAGLSMDKYCCPEFGSR